MRKIWTYNELLFLAEWYPFIQTRDLTGMMGRTIHSIYGAAGKLDLHKDPDYLNSGHCGRLAAKDTRGVPFRFKKGHVPFNKGKSWNEYLSAENQKKSLATTFKKGHKTVNHKPVGSTRVNIYGYIEKKTAEPNKWELLHRLVWKEHNGDIPPGMNVRFRDGDSLNCDISNLFLTSKRENMALNTIHRYPEEIKSAIYALSKLKKEMQHAT